MKTYLYIHRVLSTIIISTAFLAPKVIWAKFLLGFIAAIPITIFELGFQAGDRILKKDINDAKQLKRDLYLGSGALFLILLIIATAVTTLIISMYDEYTLNGKEIAGYSIGLLICLAIGYLVFIKQRTIWYTSILIKRTLNNK